MNLQTAFSRAFRGFRDDLKLHLLAIVSLVVAFICLGAALLSVENLDRIAENFTDSRHLTVYLRDQTTDDDVAQLRLVLESLGDVESFKYVSQKRAKALLMEQTSLDVDPGSLPTTAFPASLEIKLVGTVEPDAVAALAGRLSGFNAVEDVETYRDWFGQIDTLVSTGRSATGLLALLVAICVAAVIGNTIRLAVTNRRREIEVLRLCGATDGFVRTPFLLEGMFQGLAAGTVALCVLLISYFALHTHVEEILQPIMGIRTVFLQPATAAAIVVFGGVAGALGSLLSIRRYMIL